MKECPCFKVEDDVAVINGKDGAFLIEERCGQLYIHLKLPGDNYCCLPINEGEKQDRAWEWDGNREKPTITPSILQFATDPETKERIELWHGFLTEGVLRTC